MIKLLPKSVLRYPTRLGILTIVIALASISAYAGAPVPDIPKGKGKQCVEDTDFMRTNHMELLLHQRDETMYHGIRTKKHSLKECIDCHVVKGDDNQPVKVSNAKHFCRECHDYTSVKIDCFECHASKPRARREKAMPMKSMMVPPASNNTDSQPMTNDTTHKSMQQPMMEPAIEPVKEQATTGDKV